MSGCVVENSEWAVGYNQVDALPILALIFSDSFDSADLGPPPLPSLALHTFLVQNPSPAPAGVRGREREGGKDVKCTVEYMHVCVSLIVSFYCVCAHVHVYIHTCCESLSSTVNLLLFCSYDSLTDSASFKASSSLRISASS